MVEVEVDLCLLKDLAVKLRVTKDASGQLSAPAGLPQNSSSMWTRAKFLPLPGIEPCFVDRLDGSPVSIVTALCGLFVTITSLYEINFHVSSTPKGEALGPFETVASVYEPEDRHVVMLYEIQSEGRYMRVEETV
jgi:hypothetical protein